MPFSPPSERQYIHTRQVTCHGFRRADGLWDIEGHLVDVKTYPFASEHRGAIEPGDPVHDMSVRMTVDDHLTVKAIEVYTVKSPFHRCGDITTQFQKLIGLTIGAGWNRAVKERLGGPRTCAHLVELLGPVATTAFQTIYPILAREQAERERERAVREPAGQPRDNADDHGTAAPEETARGTRSARKKTARPALLDMCHIFAADGPYVARHWPDHYTGDAREPDR